MKATVKALQKCIYSNGKQVYNLKAGDTAEIDFKAKKDLEYFVAIQLIREVIQLVKEVVAAPKVTPKPVPPAVPKPTPAPVKPSESKESTK